MTPRYSAICCYFGQWPKWFKYWLSSCRLNKGIDFICVTDIPMDGYDVPENVKVLHYSFAEVQAKVRKTFPEIEVSLDRPYKLCDFKTAYGYIFHEYLADYDDWGIYNMGRNIEVYPE